MEDMLITVYKYLKFYLGLFDLFCNSEQKLDFKIY